MSQIRGSDRSSRALAVAGLVPILVVCALLVPSGDGVAAPATPPSNTAEPAISGTAEQGRTLRTSNGSWSGTQPISFAYQWVRCGADGGRPDGGDCAIVSGATSRDYRLGAGDVGFRMRARVTAANADGSRTAASNPTAVVAGPPGEHVGSRRARDNPRRLRRHGRPGFVDWQAVDLLLVPLAALQHAGRRVRLDRGRDGPQLSAHIGGHQSQGPLQRHGAELARLDDRHLGRVRSRHRAAPSGAIRLPTGEISIPASSVPSNHRLIVSQVLFGPDPVTSRNGVITVRVRAKDTRGFVVRDALVFVRSTPRVTTGGDRQLTTTDGWVDLPARAERELPEAPEGVPRAVLREGVPLGRSRARRDRRLPARAGPPGRLT